MEVCEYDQNSDCKLREVYIQCRLFLEREYWPVKGFTAYAITVMAYLIEKNNIWKYSHFSKWIF